MAAALLAASCDPAAPLNVAVGTPLLSFEAALSSVGVPDDAPVALGIFWLPAGAAALDPARWREDARPSVAVDLDAPLVVRVFAPPPAEVVAGRPFVLGALVAYADRDADGRRGPGEPILGGAARDYLLFAPAPLDAVGGPLRRDVDAGLRAVRVSDLKCPTLTVEPEPTCAAELGRACDVDADCGAHGACRAEVDGRPIPGGVCAKGSSCLSARGGYVAAFEGFVRGCERDLECRTDEGHACVPVDFGTFGCLPPAERLCDAVVGAPCARDADCGADGRCEVDSDIYGPLPGGYCVVPEAAACRPLNGRGSPLRAGEEPALRECLSDADCRVDEGYRCDRRPFRSVCVPDTDGDCASAGGRCDDDGDCPGLARCAHETPVFGALPGGMCLVVHGSAGCVWETAGWSTLGDDGLYYRSGGCGDDGDCRFASGYWCNYGAETCVPPASGGCRVPVGGPCARDADCGDGGRCLIALETAAGPLPLPGGHCRASPGGASGCTLGDGVYDVAFEGDLGLLARCGSDAECRAGWVCDPLLAGCLPVARPAVRVGGAARFEVPVCR